jgi:hypothetical protein
MLIGLDNQEMIMEDDKKAWAKDKVAKLMALAKNSAATENEAERALSQAESLMRKYGIDQAECVLNGAPNTFDWSSSFTPYGNRYHQAATLPLWYQFVATGVATFTDTIVRTHTDKTTGMGVGFYGERGDIAFAVWLMDYLRDTVQASAVAHKELSRADREAFRKGMATRLSKRMRDLRAERDVAFKAGTGTALVVVSDKLAKRDQEFGVAKYKTSKVVATNAAAAAMGRAAADKVGLGRPVGAQQQRAMLAA